MVRYDLHPAIPCLLLQAAVEIHSTPGMFHTAGHFPAPESIDLPLSPHAHEFYKTGMPFLLRHLPFPLALFLEQPVLLLIPLIVVLYPLFRFAPSIYDWVQRRRIYNLYPELRHLEDDMFYATSTRSREDLIERLNQLKDRARHLSVPTPFRPLIFGLRSHIEMVRQEAQKSISS